MELGDFICNCRKPLKIINKSGQKIVVRCGHCADCANAKSVRYTSMLNNASQEFKYSYLITLTYDEVFVPRMYLKEVDDMIYCIDVTRRKQKVSPKPKKLSTYGKIIHAFHKDEKFDEFYQRADVFSKYTEKLPYKTLRWCSAEDIQNFIKRLRFRFSKVLDSSFSYFAVSEYGPTTFRPHFHVQLFFNDARFFQYLKEYVTKSWKFGSNRCECPERSAGVCSYLSSYLNSTTHLPHYLDSPIIRPRSFHSQRLGQLAYSEIRDFVYSSVGYPFEGARISTSFGIRDVFFTQSLVHTLFPRCYNYEFQTYSNRYKLYTIHYDLSQRYGITSPTILTNLCIYNTDNPIISRFLSLLDIDYAECINLQPDTELTEYQLTLWNRIYSTILTSQHFINFCCKGIPQHNVIKETIELIDDFYKAREMYLLVTQLKMQEEYSRQYVPTYDLSPTIQKLLAFVDIDFLKDIEQKQLEHFKVFYPLFSFYDYLDNACIKNSFSYRDWKYQKKIKHKELNDANLIFVK